ncbi:4'-phosphopantetheinyl transferase family protein [Peredibacter starrii]|uniref:4'-phosphopantetheinyl transferase superfamily protein n=1 Tax=Peredibacter starrii TaxID=28202 RepID=A0AAX4HL51_9BACT|nr:4'-phosphopantetheinyl transferase superfamily protein [Peredibacter starrii]WPU64002.1 4'-phosphopantetheinyl transferase superfamily protein [Peredibacter starrii]
MLTYKLSTTLTDSQRPEWDLLTESTLGSEVHSDRKMGFLLSRVALKNALKDFGYEVSIGDLKLTDYHLIPKCPQLTISLSHTKTCGAAIVAERKEFRSVGIDIEEEKRVVKDSIIERIAHPNDHNLRNIELWCVKEAVFKVLMNTGLFPKPIEFGSIEIGPNNWVHSPSNLSGEWKMVETTPYVVAIAFLRN